MFSLIFDFRCFICNSNSNSHICEDCLKLFVKEKINCCNVCGYPIIDSKCLSCNNHSIIYYDSYDFIQYYYDYCKKLIIELKMNYNSGVLKIFQILLEKSKIFESELPVVFVPDNFLSKYFNNFARFNRLENILSAKFNIIKNPLIKKISLIKQKNKNYKNRLIDIENVYEIKKERHNRVSDEIILFDDIYTSGSTVNYCSKLLKELGYKKVHAKTIFRSYYSINV